MNQLLNKHGPTTIGELKRYLANLEANWTVEDEKYLGKFDDQSLYIDTPRGIAVSYFQFHGEFGLVAFRNGS